MSPFAAEIRALPLSTGFACINAKLRLFKVFLMLSMDSFPGFDVHSAPQERACASRSLLLSSHLFSLQSFIVLTSVHCVLPTVESLMPVTYRTLSQTLSGTLTGSLWPFNCSSINHIPTTNSSFVKSPIRCWSTRFQTCSNDARGSRLRDQISRTTRFRTISDVGGHFSDPLGLRALPRSGGMSSPLLDAHTPS